MSLSRSEFCFTSANNPQDVLNVAVKICQLLKYKVVVLLPYFICSSLAFSLISINYYIYNLLSRYLSELNHPMWQIMHVGILSGDLVQLIMKLMQNIALCLISRVSHSTLTHQFSAVCTDYPQVAGSNSGC